MPIPTDLSLSAAPSWLDTGTTGLYAYDTGLDCSDEADTAARYSKFDHTGRVSQSDTGKPALVKQFSDYVPEAAVPALQAQEVQPTPGITISLPDLSDPSVQFLFGGLFVASVINTVSFFKYDNTSWFTYLSIIFTIPYFCCCGVDFCCGTFGQLGLALLGLILSSDNPPPSPKKS